MRSLLVIFASCIVAFPAHAWHDTGHKMTAAIAFDLLDERQWRRVASVLRTHPRFEQDFTAHMPDDVSSGGERAQARWLFQQASVWPDLIQDVSDEVREEYHRGTWHYINLPVFLTKKDKKELIGSLDQNISMEFTPPLRPGLNIVQALEGNLLVWRNDNATDSEKAIALCWILHLTGDIHQPLHNVALFSAAWFPKGDRGGNSVEVEREPENTNLHAVWDGQMRSDKIPVMSTDTRDLLANDKADVDQIAAWARHGHNLARKYVYKREVRRQILAQEPSDEYPLISVSADYIAAANSLAGQQVIIAGHRIAALIKEQATGSE